MPAGVIRTLTDIAHLDSGDLHEFHFRVTDIGLITVLAKPDSLPKPTDSPFLGTLQLLRPGGTTPVATVTAKIADKQILLQHQATADEVAIPGNWVCALTNESVVPLQFTIQVMGPVVAEPLQSASIAIGLLNLLLDSATRIADVHLHAASGPPGVLSSVTWSPALASLLKRPEYTLHIDDFEKAYITFHLKSLDSDPQYPRVVLLPDPLRLNLTLKFADNAVIETDPGPDVTIAYLQITLDVAFDGTIYSDCQAHVTVNFNGIDVSDKVQQGIIDAMHSGLAALGYAASRDAVRGYLDYFFLRLLRLDDGVQIRNYRSDGRALIVDYALPTPTLATQPTLAVAVSH